MNGVRFDAYTATTTAAKPGDLLALLHRHGDQVRQGKGFHTFGERCAVVDECGDQVGYVQWGGRQGDRVMIEVKGERTPQVVEQLRAEVEQHRCTRVDSCLDVDRPGAFEALLGPVRQVKQEHGLYGERRGDWDDFPELGRTEYLGANSSAVRARLYEKGKQPEYRHCDRPDWARLEIQVRPAKDAKAEYSKLSALEVWGASKWTRQLAAMVLAEQLDAYPAGTVRRLSSRDQAMAWMVKQYGPHLVSLAADLGGWEVLGLTLGEMVREDLAKRSQAKGRRS
jgi:DNA relaxase NicK